MEIDRELIDILGVNVDIIDLEGLFRRIEGFISSGEKFKIMYLNINCSNIAKKDDERSD